MAWNGNDLILYAGPASYDRLSSSFYSLIVMDFLSTIHFLCRMSQEIKGADSLEQDILGYWSRIEQLWVMLDAAREQSPRDEASIQDIKEEVTELFGRIDNLRAIQIQAGVGVGSSTHRMYCVVGCVVCLCNACLEGYRVRLHR